MILAYSQFHSQFEGFHLLSAVGTFGTAKPLGRSVVQPCCDEVTTEYLQRKTSTSSVVIGGAFIVKLILPQSEFWHQLTPFMVEE